MTVSNLKNAANTPVNTQGILASTSVKDTFYKWLSEGDSKQHRPSSVIANLESVSVRFIKRRISAVPIWEITSPQAFIAVHKKANKDKIFCIFTGHKGMKFVNECCELFFAFLKMSNATAQSTGIVSSKTTIEEATSVATNNESFFINDELTSEDQKITEEQIETASYLSENLPSSKLVFRKEVDWSLLNYGFTIPQAAINAFCSNIDGEILRGSSHRIKLLVNNETYTASVSNVGFASDSRQQLQVRYSATSPVAAILKAIFTSSYQLFCARKNNSENQEQSAKEYIDVVCDSLDTYELICVTTADEEIPQITYFEYLKPLTQSKSSMTIKDGMIEFSVSHKGEIKTRREISEELSKRYGFPLNSIFPADYEITRNSALPKLFRRVGYGTFECLGYDPTGTISYRNDTHIYGSLDSNEQKKAKHIVAAKFKSGYRLSTNIDFERYKNYYESEHGEEFTYGAGRLDSFLSSVAVIFDNRAYVYDDEVVDSIRTLLEQMDSPCIYIYIFFEKHSCELYSFDIFSVDMLKAFIEKNYVGIFCKWDYIYLQPDASPAALIREVFDERETWSYDELSRRLPCIKVDTIKQTLNREDYFRVDVGTYTHINNMDLPESEGVKIVTFVSERLVDKDYVIANELDLSKFESLNPHCPFSAIRDAVFYKFLSHSYDKSGQVITRKGVRLRVLDILEQYCREAEIVSFDELNSFEATFDPEGRTHSQCLIAAHNTMVRVSTALFVTDSKVSFDVEEIDEILANYCQDDFIPIKSVTDFSSFPYTGYGWNLFLLESFVRKYSRIFKYDVRAVNSANIGVIVRNSFIYNEYDDILATALAKASVSLGNKREISDYLFDNGYIGWRNLGKSEGKILAKAKMLREGGAV